MYLLILIQKTVPAASQLAARRLNQNSYSSPEEGDSTLGRLQRIYLVIEDNTKMPVNEKIYFVRIVRQTCACVRRFSWAWHFSIDTVTLSRYFIS
jgi:hypothetical protein